MNSGSLLVLVDGHDLITYSSPLASSFLSSVTRTSMALWQYGFGNLPGVD